MPTLTIRNVPPRVVQSLKSLARRNGRSMEQELREVIEEHVSEREAILTQIEASWTQQRVARCVLHVHTPARAVQPFSLTCS